MTLKSVVEALLFASQKPLSPTGIQAVLAAAAKSEPAPEDAAHFADAELSELHAILLDLQQQYAEDGRAFRLMEIAGGWQLVSEASHAPWVRQLYPDARPSRLSAAALETLAIVAYRQPITRADIEAVRGVAVDGVLATLLERDLLRLAGRADQPGRPGLYETTHAFLDHFGLRSLDDLPNAEELRRAPLPTAAECDPDPDQPTLGFGSTENSQSYNVAETPPSTVLAATSAQPPGS